jgi:hypothetical protein
MLTKKTVSPSNVPLQLKHPVILRVRSVIFCVRSVGDLRRAVPQNVRSGTG